MPAITRCIHTIPGGYYLQWELLDVVYCEAFSFTRYGNPKKALKAATRLRDALDEHRDFIYAKLGPELVEIGKVVEVEPGKYKPIRAKRVPKGEPDVQIDPLDGPQIEPLRLKGISGAPPEPAASSEKAGNIAGNISKLAERIAQARIEKQKRAEGKATGKRAKGGGSVRH